MKIALLARLRSVQTRSAQTKTRLEQRRWVAVLGNIDALRSRLQLEALRRGVTTAPQVVWIVD